MTSIGKHHKHPPLTKPSIGEWGRNEVAFLGAPCSLIRSLSENISEALGESRRVCYVDADHSTEDTGSNNRSSFDATFTDKIQNRRFETIGDPSMFGRRALLSGEDVILINGNHFTAKQQIVLLHSGKLESLQRKTDRLTNVIAVVEIDTSLEACPFLNAFLHTDTKVFRSGELEALITWLADRMTVPSVKGLVLAGGKSLRMGTDKSLIQYHGIPQREYMLKLIDALGIPVYLSCRPDQVGTINTNYPLLPDRIMDLGPYGAILSALMSSPDSAWLVVATDLPLVSQETLKQLLAQRNPAKMATAFHNPATGFPDPLITLWEPKAYSVLLSFLSQGNSCPRKALINSDINLIEADDPRWLMNVNTPEDVDAVRASLAG